MNLGFDIDGVIANFTAPLIDTIKKNYGVTLTEKDIYCFHLNTVLGITKTEETDLITEILKQDLPLYVGAKETLNKLSREGHSIFLLTGRWGYLREVTEVWLKDKGVSYTELHLLNVGKKYQADIAELDLIVEDSLEDALEWTRRVKNVLVYDHPYNQTFNVKKLTKRVHNWSEIYHEIQQLKSSNQRGDSTT